MFTRVFPLFSAFFLFLSPLYAVQNENTQYWSINKNIESLLGKNLSSEFLKSLSDVNKEATYVSFDKFIEQYKIFEGKFFTVFLAPRYFHKDHIWIVTNPSAVSKFEDMGIAQLSELEEIRYLIGEVLLNHLNYDGYFAFIDAQKSYGLNIPHLCLEIIPGTLKGEMKNEFDPFEKLKRVWYAFYDVDGDHFLSPSDAKDTIHAFQDAIEQFKKNGKVLSNQKRIVKNTLPLNFIQTYSSTLREYCLNIIYQDLLKTDSLLMGNALSYVRPENKKDMHVPADGEFKHDQIIESKIEKCAFCNPKVIDNQLVYRWGNFVALYNYLPYTPGYHFMILPDMEYHVENWQYLSLKDAIQIDQFLQTFAKVIKEDSKRDDIIIFLQNGLAGGATVPHDHIHILLRPSQLYLMAMNLIEVTGNKLSGLTASEMLPIKQKFQELIHPLIEIIKLNEDKTGRVQG